MGMWTQRHENKTNWQQLNAWSGSLSKTSSFFHYSLKKQPVKHVHVHWCYDYEGVQWIQSHIETTHTHTLVYVHTLGSEEAAVFIDLTGVFSNMASGCCLPPSVHLFLLPVYISDIVVSSSWPSSRLVSSTYVLRLGLWRWSLCVSELQAERGRPQRSEGECDGGRQSAAPRHHLPPIRYLLSFSHTHTH